MKQLSDTEISNLLHAASVAVSTSGAYENRNTLLDTFAKVQAALAPPAGDLTWRSHDGRVRKISEMEDDHLVNALHVLARRPEEGMSPLFPALWEELLCRFSEENFARKVSRKQAAFIIRKALDVYSLGFRLGWVKLEDRDLLQESSYRSWNW